MKHMRCHELRLPRWIRAGVILASVAALAGCATASLGGANQPLGAGGAALHIQFPHFAQVPEPVRTAAGTGTDPFAAWNATTANLSAWAALDPSSIDNLPMPIPPDGEEARRVRLAIARARRGDARAPAKGEPVAPVDLYLLGVSDFVRKDYAAAKSCWDDMRHDATPPDLAAAASVAVHVAQANDIAGSDLDAPRWTAGFDAALSSARDRGLIDAATHVKLLAAGRVWVRDPRPIHVHRSLDEAPTDTSVRRFLAAARLYQSARSSHPSTRVSAEEAATLLVMIR